MTGRAKRWCFTLNNYNDTEYNTIISTITEENPTFAIVGKEEGESGTPHLQGFIHLRRQIRITQLRKLLSVRAHYEIARGTDTHNLEYCKKQDSEPFIIGLPAIATTEKGGSSKARQAFDIAERVAAGEKITDIASTDETKTSLMIYTSQIKRVADTLREEHSRKKLKAEMSDVTLRVFQKNLEIRLCGPVHDRQIMWYWDEHGNTGKTWFSKYLVGVLDAVRFENGKSSDIKHAYHGESIVVFDFCRAQQDHINYEVIESVKNGVIFSGKYESACKIFDVPHVLCFSNQPPDETKMSTDRWSIHEITEEETRPCNSFYSLFD